jgi:hypothetical protein
MPLARAGIHTLLISLIVMVCNAIAVGADGVPASDGKGPDAAPVRPGAVQQGLRDLYIMPKDPAEKQPAGASTSSSQSVGSASPEAWRGNSPARSRGYTPPKPVPRWSPNLAVPYRLRDPASPQKVAANVPDEADLRSAGLGDSSRPPGDEGRSYGSPSIGGYRGFGPYGYGRRGYYDYRRTMQWPNYTMDWSDPVNGSGHVNTYSYGDYGYGGYGYGGNQDLAFQEGRAKWGWDFDYFEYMANARTGSLLQSSLNSRDRGLAAFRVGQYREAVDAFRLACDANQADPAARLYAGHALFAVGRYHDAVRYLRKAFELQPRIVFVTFDMRDDYRDRADFDRQFAALEDALRQLPRDPDRLFMIGYVLYYGGQRDRAYGAFARLVQSNPHDSLAVRLMGACQPPDVEVSGHSAEAGTRWP